MPPPARERERVAAEQKVIIATIINVLKPTALQWVLAKLAYSQRKHDVCEWADGIGNTLLAALDAAINEERAQQHVQLFSASSAR